MLARSNGSKKALPPWTTGALTTSLSSSMATCPVGHDGRRPWHLRLTSLNRSMPSGPGLNVGATNQPIPARALYWATAPSRLSPATAVGPSR